MNEHVSLNNECMSVCLTLDLVQVVQSLTADT